MLGYRIVHEKWSHRLSASGNAGRWNSKGKFVIYTSASRALACLENIVHRSGEGLHGMFRVMVIEIPDAISFQEIKIKSLPKDWKSMLNFPVTRKTGDEWYSENKFALLKVPSSVISKESNFIINTHHSDFKKIKLKSVELFDFDLRLE